MQTSIDGQQAWHDQTPHRTTEFDLPAVSIKSGNCQIKSRLLQIRVVTARWASAHLASYHQRPTRAANSPMIPRRNASTQTTKISPVTIVTDSPIELNHSICVIVASQVPKSPN
jgi:hypothetical protein